MEELPPEQAPSSDLAYGYHALSLDEGRFYFPVSFWDDSEIPEGQTIEQVWFPGYHGDVGGQMADRRISDISLEWMLRKAESQGLRLRDDWAKRLTPDPLRDIKQSRRNVWRLLPERKRRVPESARVHSSVVKEQGNGKPPLVTQFGGIPLKRNRQAILVDQQPQRYRTDRNELVKRLLADECEMCGSTEDVQVHHVRALRDLNVKGQGEKPRWVQIMAARKRKTLVVCGTCHMDIHHGRK